MYSFSLLQSASELWLHLTTFCKVYGLDEGLNLLEKDLRQCADSECEKCPDTVKEIDEYFTSKVKELQEELDKKSYDTG